MNLKRRKRRRPLIAERQEIQSDPSLYTTPEIKSRLINHWSSALLSAKLGFLKRQTHCSTTEVRARLSDFLNRMTQREHLNRRFHG